MNTSSLTHTYINSREKKNLVYKTSVNMKNKFFYYFHLHNFYLLNKYTFA